MPLIADLAPQASSAGNRHQFHFLDQGPQRILEHLGRLQDAPDLGDDGVLDHARRQAGRRLTCAAVVLRRAVLDHVHRHVIAVKLASVLGRGRGHRRAGIGEDQALQRRGRLHAAVAGPRVAVGFVHRSSFIVQPSGGGFSTSELISDIEARIQVYDLILKLRTVVADTLGRDMQSALSWSSDLQRATSLMRIFGVSTIPAIRDPLPAGVSGARFLVDLAGCRQLPRARIDALVSAERALMPP